MKKMTCQMLGGACDLVFQAETFDEIAGLSQEHGKAMFAQSDPAHLAAMNKMMGLMQDPNAMKDWMDGKRAEFEALPEAD
ncbi:MAG: DUF1059 domain-containing protein [Reinekea forsetii]|jgi:hypothetical protein|uniref:DUF1059 domain-containing protein n=1 Tax=Reinekea TaxID=230494 RepID=UPI0023531615|nr:MULTISPECIES: DUF1059 domain-containing protein [Reinekea]MDO7640372.1 DUF1059 domain-containing protein [Reinekea forsetii]MDO7643815.1 DUF1059 domain-containing protein [Reinekea forsetii]MDO7673525.1 DUF1059 domain-containing protein [Reinekea forsetii]|tara:strand:+ start:669 stop:908 length:240 start_codon:yes stop_codon:yes gene_type:complete